MVKIENGKVEVLGPEVEHPCIKAFWDKLVDTLDSGCSLWAALSEDEQDTEVSCALLSVVKGIEKQAEEFILRESTKAGFSQGVKLAEEFHKLSHDVVKLAVGE